jgi:hypothetical protein
MTMKTLLNHRRSLCALLLALSFASCIGPFNATSRVHTWNREIGNRWAGEGVFLVLRALPIYAICTVGDLLIFNSIEFWGGTNPIDPPARERVKALWDADDARAAESREGDGEGEHAEGDGD